MSRINSPQARPTVDWNCQRYQSGLVGFFAEVKSRTFGRIGVFFGIFLSLSV